MENNQDDQRSSTSIVNFNDIAIANDATQLLLTQLGIVRRKYIASQRLSGFIDIDVLIDELLYY